MQTYAIVLIVVFSILAFILLLGWLVGHMVFKVVFKKDDKPEDPNRRLVSPDKKYRLEYDEEWLKTMKYEEVKIEAEDKAVLFGRLVKCPSSHKYLISCHGYRGSWKEMSLPEHELFKKGYSILMIDERATGLSGGNYITFGFEERNDIKLWAEYISKLDKDAQIVLYGLSMGSGSIMMSLDNNLPSNVKCVICDCGYSTIKDEIVYILKGMKNIPYKLIYRLLAITAYFHHGFSFTKYSPVKSLANDNIPILLIHGEEDTYVPFYMCDINYKAVKKGTYKQMETFPHAWHALSYQVDKERYNKVCETFVNKFIV